MKKIRKKLSFHYWRFAEKLIKVLRFLQCLHFQKQFTGISCHTILVCVVFNFISITISNCHLHSMPCHQPVFHLIVWLNERLSWIFVVHLYLCSQSIGRHALCVDEFTNLLQTSKMVSPSLINNSFILKQKCTYKVQIEQFVANQPENQNITFCIKNATFLSTNCLSVGHTHTHTHILQ